MRYQRLWWWLRTARSVTIIATIGTGCIVLLVYMLGGVFGG